MTGLSICDKKPITVGTVFTSALVLIATGFLFKAGYDIYERIFKKKVA
jgi:hypothetical protein